MQALIQPETERVILYNKISGPVYTVINLIVFILIIFDPDHRHTKYRRYLLMLQFICMISDGFITIIGPIVLARQWIVYASGYMPLGISMMTAIMIYCFILIEIVMAYVSCGLFCHQAILPKESPVNLHGWFHFVLALLNTWLLIFMPGIYYASREMEYELSEIPQEISWILTKANYYAFHSDDRFVWTMVGGGVVFSFPIYITANVIFLHMVYIVQTGMAHMSAAARKTQTRAAISITLQLAVPSIALIIPLGAQIVSFLLRIDIVPDEATAVGFTLVNSHAVINSLIILLRSKYYMKMLSYPFLYCWYVTRRAIDPSSLAGGVAPSLGGHSFNSNSASSQMQQHVQQPQQQHATSHATENGDVAVQ